MSSRTAADDHSGFIFASAEASPCIGLTPSMVKKSLLALATGRICEVRSAPDHRLVDSIGAHPFDRSHAARSAVNAV